MKSLSPKLLILLLGLACVTLLLGADLKSSPPAWEYKTLWMEKDKNAQGKLNELGAEGLGISRC